MSHKEDDNRTMIIYVVTKLEIDSDYDKIHNVEKAFTERLDAEMLCRELNVKYEHHYSNSSFHVIETELLQND